MLYTVSSFTNPIFQALPVKWSAGPGSPLGKMVPNSLPSLFDLFSLQLIVSNATEVIAIINNAFILFQLIDLIIFAGIPPTIVFAATSFDTTAPAATTAFSPMVTPGSIVAPAPIHALLLM